jgi:hypothetical protein
VALFPEGLSKIIREPNTNEFKKKIGSSRGTSNLFSVNSYWNLVSPFFSPSGETWRKPLLLLKGDMMKRTSHQIAKGNDMLRTSFKGSKWDKIRLTNAVVWSGKFHAIKEAIKKFNAFSEDNDPYKEHDFGMVTVSGDSYYFKFDYYDKELRFGADPYEDTCFRRVMTVMHTKEY